MIPGRVRRSREQTGKEKDMLYVVTGGSGSGKSEYAENLAVCLAKGQALYYVATMEPGGEEGWERVRRHQALRADKGFQTIECYTDIGRIPARIGAAGCKTATVLVECMSNLLANEMFGKTNQMWDDRARDRLLEQMRSLSKQCKHLIVVTNEVFSDGICYASETEQYKRQLAWINGCLVDLADEAVEIVCTIPIRIKERKAEG